MKELSLQEERALFYGALGSATFVNPAALSRGHTDSAAVKELQELLLAKGYNLGSWGADGDFGGATEAAVKKFQSDNGLSVTGIADEATWQKLTGQGQKGKKTWDWVKKLVDVLPGVIPPRQQTTTTLPLVVVPPTPPTASPWGTVAIVGGIVVVLGVGIWGIARLTRKD